MKKNCTIKAINTASGHSTIRFAALAAMSIASVLAMRPAAAAYEVVSVPNGGAIEGYVSLSGDAPAGELKVTKNQDYCGTSIPDPTYAVDGAGGLGNVIVYLKDITKGKAPPTDPKPLVSDHCMIQPRVQAAMVGEEVKISSNDAILHNIHPLRAQTNTTIYNVALPFAGVSVTKPLPHDPGLIKVKCDAQEWMQAWIMAVDNPYYATTDAGGHFTIKDVPPGNYTLVAWHEAAGEKSEPVMVTAGQTSKSKVTLAAR
jgi:hypothetical protein